MPTATSAAAKLSDQITQQPLQELCFTVSNDGKWIRFRQHCAFACGYVLSSIADWTGRLVSDIVTWRLQSSGNSFRGGT